LSTARAVVIDDEEAPRYALRCLLAPMGFEVREYEHPEVALRQVLASPPDVLFLDLIMPGLTGLALLESLRQDSRTRELPAVLITSKVLVPGERETAGRLGASIVSKDVLGQPQAAAELQQGLARAGWHAEAPPSPPPIHVERS
jgi:CheY-like chemotaxis protein